MAKRPRTSTDLPDALRDAVDRTVSATVETRGRAQDAVDDLVRGAEAGVRGAEAGLTRRAGAVRDAMGERLPATQDDLKELRAELRAIGRRLDAIEQRLPAQPKRKSKPKAKQGARAGRAKRSAGG
jgi:hypothetical protein